QALAVVEPLDKEGKLKRTQFAQEVGEMKQEVALCERATKAIADLDFALQQPAALVPGLLQIRATALVRRGQHAAAATTADKLAGLDAKNGPNLYNAACYYTLCIPAVAHGKKSGQLTAADQALQERYAVGAVELLSKVQEAGYFKSRANIDHL